MTAIFEDANMLVQPVDASVDIGKDLYVDLTGESTATGELIAVQVKAGTSYRRSNGYAIPCDANDIALWRRSTVPIFGIVHDPETNGLHWKNLTAWARGVSESDTRAKAAPVAATWRLDEQTLRAFVAEARQFIRASGPPSLIGLASDDPITQLEAVLDAFALGRRDSRPLLLLRASLRYLGDPAPLRAAIHVLALCAGHGDIFWNAQNWIDRDVAARVCREMTWSFDELCKLLAAPEPDEYSRGGLGQDVAALLQHAWAPDVRRQLEGVVVRADKEAAWPALMILVTEAGNEALEMLDELVSKSGALRSEPAVLELRSVLVEHGFASMW